MSDPTTPVNAPNPPTTAAVAAITYPYIRLSSFNVISQLNQPIQVSITFQFWRFLDDGVTQEVLAGGDVSYNIPDLAAKLGAYATANPTLAAPLIAEPQDILTGAVTLAQFDGAI